MLDLELMLVCAGGNLDDRRIGIGASMYYPVSVEGGLLSMGDAHSAQGDSEFDGQSHAWTDSCIIHALSLTVSNTFTWRDGACLTSFKACVYSSACCH